MIGLTEIVKKIKLSNKEKFNKKLMLAKDDNEKLDAIYNLLKKEEDSGAYLNWNDASNNVLYYEIIHIIERLRTIFHITNKQIQTKDFILSWSYDESSDNMPEFFIKEK